MAHGHGQHAHMSHSLHNPRVINNNMHMQLLHKVVRVNSRIPGLHAGAGGGLHRLGYELLVILQNVASGPSYIWPIESVCTGWLSCIQLRLP